MDGSSQRRRQRTEVAMSLSMMVEEESLVLRSDDHVVREASQETSNSVWRAKVAQWFYNVVDHLGESRDTVFVAMNILDRFCALDAQTQDIVGISPTSTCSYAREEKSYETAAMTGLFLALKLCGKRPSSASDITRMGQHGTDRQEIATVGKSMISMLSWDHRLFTPLNFVRAFLTLLPPSVQDNTRRSLLESASYLVEVSVCDTFFSGLKSSDVAFAALLNVFNFDATMSRLSQSELTAFLAQVQEVTYIQQKSSHMTVLRNKLHEIYLKSAESNHPQPQLVPEDIIQESNSSIVLSRPVIIRAVSSDTVRFKKTLVRSHAVTSFADMCETKPSISLKTTTDMDITQASSTKKRAVSPPPMCEDKRSRSHSS